MSALWRSHSADAAPVAEDLVRVAQLICSGSFAGAESVACSLAAALAPVVERSLLYLVVETRAPAQARAELETGLQTAGFADLFAPDHLDSPKGVQAARLAAGTASAYVARYRRREAEIEQAYADSFAVLSKWRPTASRRALRFLRGLVRAALTEGGPTTCWPTTRTRPRFRTCGGGVLRDGSASMRSSR